MKEFLSIPKLEPKYFSHLIRLVNVERTWAFNGIWCRLITPDKIPQDLDSKPLLAIHPDRKYLWQLENIKRVLEMFVIPWDQESITDWIRHYKAEWNSGNLFASPRR
jgi:hypothetical protein